MLQSDPYHMMAGHELDTLIHWRIMKQVSPRVTCPAYSSEDKQAKKVLAALRHLGRGCVIIGRTHLEGKGWFARYETNAMDGTEVFAETFALAVCRIAMLRIIEMDRQSDNGRQPSVRR